MKSLTQAEYDWLDKVIRGQQEVAHNIARDVERLFYSRWAKYRDQGQAPSDASRSALEEMNRDPWGASERRNEQA
jgi:hypothetical protein